MMRERITSTSSKTKERHKKFFMKLVWSLLVLVLFLIGLAFVSRIDSLLIKEVSVSGNEILEEEEVVKEVFDILSENRFLFFSGENRFIYSKNKIDQRLKKTFPRILSLDIKLESKKLFIDLVERERAYLWCGENAPNYEDDSSDQECYFLDNSSFIFDISPQFSSGVYFTFYSKLLDENPIGQTVLDYDFLKDVELLISSLRDKNFPIHSLAIKEEGQYELLLNIPTVSGEYPKLLFTADQSISEIYNKFISTIEEDPFKTDFLEKPNRLEYIDARFKNRIFYRFID